MSSYWEDLASRLDAIYEPEDFEAAAYRLVSEQVIYHSDRASRASYGLIELYERDFSKVLAPLGISVMVNRQLRYVVALPRHARTSTATVAQTLFTLVLRGLYEDGARAGDLTEDAEVMVDFIELQEKYRLMTGRDLPPKGELDTLMRAAKRWGIARRLDDDDSAELTPLQEQSVSGVAIRPAIVEVLGETALTRLAQWAQNTSSEVDAEETTVVASDVEGKA
ncbi:MAG: DUF4194 domain-containing protein [Bacillota bacterium]|nr:DUF4194 domain-containing protein [Bacillota bacterium]